MHHIIDPDLRNNLIDAYLHLDCYPEITETLATLKTREFKIAILSNGTPAMLAVAFKNSKIEHIIEEIFSVEEVRIFKPHARVYQIAADKLNLKPEEIVFQSSNA